MGDTEETPEWPPAEWLEAADEGGVEPPTDDPVPEGLADEAWCTFEAPLTPECIEDALLAPEIGRLALTLTELTCWRDKFDANTDERPPALESVLAIWLPGILLPAARLSLLCLLSALCMVDPAPHRLSLADRADSRVDWTLLCLLEPCALLGLELDRLDWRLLDLLLIIESTLGRPPPAARLPRADDSRVEPNLDSCPPPGLPLMRLTILEATLLRPPAADRLLWRERAEPTELRMGSSPGPAKISDVCDW